MPLTHSYIVRPMRRGAAASLRCRVGKRAARESANVAASEPHRIVWRLGFLRFDPLEQEGRITSIVDNSDTGVECPVLAAPSHSPSPAIRDVLQPTQIRPSCQGIKSMAARGPLPSFAAVPRELKTHGPGHWAGRSLRAIRFFFSAALIGILRFAPRGGIGDSNHFA